MENRIGLTEMKKRQLSSGKLGLRLRLANFFAQLCCRVAVVLVKGKTLDLCSIIMVHHQVIRDRFLSLKQPQTNKLH